MNKPLIAALALTVLTGCPAETSEWGVCHGITGSDDPADYYFEFGDTELCVENSTAYDRETCEADGGTWEVVLETAESVIDSDILEPLALEACEAAGYAATCPGPSGFSKASVKDAADCPAFGVCAGATLPAGTNEFGSYSFEGVDLGDFPLCYGVGVLFPEFEDECATFGGTIVEFQSVGGTQESYVEDANTACATEGYGYSCAYIFELTIHTADEASCPVPAE